MQISEKQNLLLVVTGCIITTLFAVVHYDIIPRDGVLYLETANAFNLSGIHSAFKTHEWPFFQILLGILHIVTNIPYEPLAIGFGMLCDIGTTFVFYKILKQIKLDNIEVFLGIILFFSFRKFQGLHVDILRDHAFWLFCTAGSWLLLKFFESPKIRYAISSTLLMIASMLMRTEGLFYIILPSFIPWILPLSNHEKLRLSLKLAAPLLVLGSLGILLFALIKNTPLDRINEMHYALSHLDHYFFSQLKNQAHALQLLYSYLDNTSALAIITIRLIGIFTLHFISVLSIPCLLLFFYPVTGETRPVSVSPKRILLSLFTIGLVGPFIFVLPRGDLSLFNDRYFVISTLFLLCLLPPHLKQLITQFSQQRKLIQLLSAGILLGLLLQIMGSFFHFGTDKSYIKTAGTWLSTQSIGKLLVNDTRLTYYSYPTTPSKWYRSVILNYQNFPTKLKSNYYDAVAINGNRKEISKISQVMGAAKNYILAKSFTNNKNDQVLIYLPKSYIQKRHALPL